MRDPDPERSVGFLLHEVSRLLRRNFNRRVQDLGMSQAQWQALAHLSRLEGASQVTLAERLEIQPITLGRLIDRLEESGLVERRRDPADRRAVRLYLTAKAQPLIDRMWAVAAKTREDAMASLPEERRELLIETLYAMKANLLDAEREGATAKAGRVG